MIKNTPEFQTSLTTYIRPRYPEHESTVLAIVDAHDTALQTGILTPDQLTVLTDAYTHPLQVVHYYAVRALRDLACTHPHAADALLRLSRHPKLQVRFNTIIYLNKYTPRHLVDPILKAGLTDKSAKVRQFAVQAVDTSRADHLLPDLLAALATESDPKVLQSMEFHIPFVRDGYSLKPDPHPSHPPNTYHLEVRTKSGYFGATVSQSDLDTKGIAHLVAEIQSREI